MLELEKLIRTGLTIATTICINKYIGCAAAFWPGS